MSAVDAIPLLAAAGGDYQISRSVRLRSSASAYLTRTLGSNSTSQTKMTWSGWLKRGALSAAGRQSIFYLGNSAASGTFFEIEFNGDGLRVYLDPAPTYYLVTTQVFRDPSAWYHIAVSVDTTQSTAANRVSVYVNGVQVAAFSTATYPTQNYAINNVATTVMTLGNLSALLFDGYMAEINFVDGQALAPSSFGETDAVTGVWKPKKYIGTYGTNGFYLKFDDPSAATAAAIGKDSSGNGNNWTPNNISVTSGVTYDSMLDTPTPYADGGNGRGNYATWNATSKSPNLSLTAGNLNTTYASAGNESAGATIGVTSGKWYWESTATNVVGSFPMLGIAKANEAGLRSISGYYPGYSANSWGLYCNTGGFVNNASVLATYSTVATNDVLMFALDMDSGKYWMGKNGTWFNSGAPASGTGSILSSGLTGETIFPMVAEYLASSSVANFGQRPFAYTPPTGFKALNTQNLPEATIKKGNAYFNVSLFTGTGSAQTITNSGAMQPDLVWVKGRGEVASNRLVDSVRGVNNVIYSNLTNAETSESGVVTAFNSNGFTGGGANAVTSGYAGVAWQWKESASAGFDIVTHTGTGGGSVRTIAHSLGVVPSMIVTKCRGAAVFGTDGWVVYFKGFAVNDYIFLNTTGAKGSSANYLPALPTSSVFSVGGTSANVSNESGLNYVSYLFAEVAGFSKFGSYVGNGSADGPFVYCGFRPRWILFKNITSGTASSDWAIFDTSRNTSNAVTNILYPDLSNAEASATFLDVVSNGFKLRAVSTMTNSNSSETIIYAAFAENPFKNSLAR